MKIVFDNKKEKKKFINRVLGLSLCPSAIGLEDAQGSKCGFGLCESCWEKALKEGSKK